MARAPAVELRPQPRRSAAQPGRPPATASDYVAAEIRAGILRGTFALGSRLDQQVLADRLGVSIIPVREGLRRLEAEGLVEIVPRRGAFVSTLSLEELTEISWIRERLETLAIRLAAPNYTESDLQRLRDLNERLARTPATGSATQWGNLNREWHLALYTPSRAPLLLQMIALLWDRSLLYRELNAARMENRIHAIEEHHDVIRCIEGGDIAGACRSLRRHIVRAARHVLDAESARTLSEDEP